MVFGIMWNMKMATLKKLLKLLAVAIGTVLLAVAILIGASIGLISCARDNHCRKHARQWMPKTATDIHCKVTKNFGSYEVRFGCRTSEADFVRFAQEHSHVVATNSFAMLDYGHYEQEDSSFVEWRREQMETDDERQRKLVFDGSPVPDRFLSITKSHAFDGGAVGGSSMEVVVFDQDTGVLTGYIYVNCL